MNKSIETKHLDLQGLDAIVCTSCSKGYLKTRKWQTICVPCMRYLGIIDKHPMCSKLITINKKIKL